MTQGSHSVGSSVFSAESEAQSSKGTSSVDASLFPTLVQLRTSWGPKLSMAGLALQWLQMYGMIVNTVTDWGSVMDMFTKGVSFFTLPIWEPTFITNNRKIAATVFFWGYLSVLAISAIVFCFIVRDSGRNRLPAMFVVYMQRVLHVAGSVAFLPVSNLLLSFMVCKNDQLRSYTEPCWGVWHAIHFTAGVGGLLILLTFSYIANVILFSMTPLDPSISASRAHSQFDEYFLAARTLIVVGYHLTLDEDTRMFPVIMICTMTVTILWLSVQLPYYNMKVTQLLTAGNTVTLWAAIVALIKNSGSEQFTEDNYPALLLGLGSLVAFGIGYAFPTIRVSSRCKAAAKSVAIGEPFTCSEEFPKYLPNADMQLSRCAGLCEQLNPPEHPQDEGCSESEVVTTPLEILEAYVRAIYTPSDIEVATRFVHEHVRATGQHCTPKMLKFALRMFTKGMVKYPDYAVVLLHMVSYLVYFAGGVGIPGAQPVVICITAALTETEHINGMEASRVTLFQNHLLQTMMKPLIGMTNDSHRKVMAAALRMYKDILGQMYMFWNKLLVSENVDTMQLAVITHNVTSCRGEGLEAFQKALAHPTYNLIRKYAQFLRYVMIDEDSAHTLESKLTYMQRERSMKQSGATTDFGEVTSEMATKKLAKVSDSESSRMSSTIRRFSVTINVMFVALVLIVVVFIILEAMLSGSRNLLIDQAIAVGSMRGVASQAAVIVEKISKLSSLPSLSAEDLVVLSSLKSQLSDLATSYESNHYKLTHGSLKSSYAPLADFMESGPCEHKEVGRDGTLARAIIPMQAMSLQYSNALYAIANSAAAAGGDTSRGNDILYVEANALSSLAPALNRSMTYLEESHDATEEKYMWIKAGIFVLALFLVFFVYFTMAMNFQKVGASKIATLNLFKYIPHVHLTRLSDEAAARVASCDIEDDGGDGLDPLLEMEGNDKTDVSNVDKRKSEVEVAKQSEVTKVFKEAEAMDNESNGDKGGDDEENDDEALIASKTSQSSEKLSKFVPVMLVTSFVLIYLLSIINVTSLLLMSRDVQKIQDDFEDAKNVQVKQETYSVLIEKLSVQARLYAQQGIKLHLDRYWEILKTTDIDELHTNLILGSVDKTDVEQYSTGATALEHMVKLHMVALALVQEGQNNTDLIQFLPKVMNDVEWNTSTSLEYELSFYNGLSIKPPLKTLSTSQADLALDEEERMELSRALLYSERYKRDKQVALNAFSSQKINPVRYDNGLPILSVCLAVSQIATAIAIHILARRHTGFEKIYAFKAVLAIALVLSIISACLVSLGMQTASEAEGHSDGDAGALLLFNETRIAFTSSGDAALGYIQFGEAEYLDAFIDIVNTGNLVNIVEDVVMETNSADEYADLIDAYQALRLVRAFEYIALSRAAAVYKKTRGDVRDWANELYYNVEESLDIKQHLYEYSWENSNSFNSSEQDAKLPVSEQMELARFSLGNRLHETTLHHAEKQFLKKTRSAVHHKEKLLSDSKTQLRSYIISSLFAQLAVTGILVVYAAYSVAIFLNIMSGFAFDMYFFPTLMRNCRLSLTFFAALLCVVYVLTFVQHGSVKNLVREHNGVSAREWYISESMFTAMQLFENNYKIHERYKLVGVVHRYARLIGENRRDISFTAALSTDFDISAYGDIRKSSTQHTANGPNSDRDVGICADAVQSTPLQRLTQLNKGTELSMFTWLSLLEQLSMIDPTVNFSHPEGRLLDIKTKLYSLESELYKKCVQGSGHQASFSRDTISAASLFLYVFLCGVMLVVLLGYLLVFRPMVRYLRAEEEGTTLMLTMIPQDVRETVPAIAEYLSTGTITVDAKIQESNEWIVEYSAVATIVADHLGTITRFSRAAREKFGYDLEEALGKNLKMLMPEEHSIRHDEYLATYRKTGVRHIIGTMRKLNGLSKSGNTFPASITVRELKRPGRDPVYIGNVMCLREEILLESVMQIGNSLIKASMLPIVIASTLGTISNVSDSATEVFGVRKGMDLKVMMPEKVAIKHDGYLEQFVSTRKPHVIGKLLDITALTPTGELNCELMVQDFYDSDGNLDGFVGYLRDLTATNDIKFAGSMCDTILKLTPDPMIAMDQVGTINIWNRRASIMFGYEEEEVIGQNVKMLMPPEIAAEHDEYLARYLRTGEKKVINNITRVTVRHQKGNFIEGDLGVREVGSMYIAYFRDTRLEMELQRQVYVQNKVMMNSSSAILIISTKGTIESVGLVTTRLFEYTEEELLGKNVNVLMAEDVARAHDGYLLAYSQTRVKKVIDQRVEVQGRTKSGVLLQLELYVLEVSHGTNNVYVGTLSDITQKKQMQRVMAVNKQVISRSGCPVIVADHLGTVTQFNHSAEEIFGWSAKEIIGKNVALLQPEDIAVRHDRILAEYYTTRKKKVLLSPRVLSIKKRNGDIQAAELTVKEVCVEGMDPIFMASVRDTALDRMDADLNNRKKIVIDNPQYLYIAITRSGIVTTFNIAAEKTTQFRREEMIGKNIKKIMPEGVAKNHDEFLRTYLRTGKKRVVDNVTRSSLQRKDGVMVPIELHVKELRSKDSNSVSFIAYIKDMMALQIAVQNNSIKDSLIKACPTPIISTDHYGTITMWNPACEEETGWSAEDAIGRNIKIIQPPEIARIHDEKLKTYRKTGEKRVIDSSRVIHVKRKDKTLYKAELFLKEVEIKKEKSLLACVNNIEQLEKIKKEEEQGKILLDMSLAGYVAMDGKGTVSIFNNKAEEIWGWKASEVLGQNVKMLMPEPTRTNHDGYLAKYALTGAKMVLNTTQMLEAEKKDKSKVHVQLTVKEMKIRDESLFVGHVSDATYIKTQQQQLAIAENIRQMSPTPLLSITATGIIQLASTSVAKMFGYEEKELLGSNVSMLMPPSIAVFHDGYLERYKEDRIRRVIGTLRELDGKKRDGTLFPVRLSIQEINSDDYEAFYVGSIEDIGEEKELEKKVVVTTQLLDLSPVTVVVMQIDGIVQRTNTSMQRTFGYTKEEVVGKNVKMLMPDHIAQNHDAFLANYKKTGIKRIVGSKRVVVGRRNDNTEFMAEVSVTEVVGDDHPNVYVGYVNDMTMEEQAKEACVLCSAITTLSIVPIVSIDTQGHVLKFTPSAEEAFGWESSDVLSQNVKMLMPPEIAEKHDEYLAKYVETGKKKMIDGVNRIICVRRDGSRFPAKATIREVHGNQFFAPTYVGFVQDESAKDEMQLTVSMNKILLDVSVLPIIKIDIKGSIQYINDAGCAMFGYEKPEVEGKNIKMLVGAEHRDNHDGYLSSYLKTGIKNVVNTVRTVNASHKTNPEFSIMIKVREVLTEKERVYIGFLEHTGNISKIENTKKTNDMLFSLVQVPVVVISQQGIVVKFSSSARHVLGFSDAEIIGSSVNLIIPPDTAATHDDKIKTYLRTKIRTMIGAHTEVSALSKSGGVIPIVIAVHQITTEGGIYFVALIDPML